MRATLRWLGWGVGGVLGLALLYLLAALIGSLVVVNRAQPGLARLNDPAGVPIWVRTTPAHADIIVPMRAAGIDWSVTLPLRTLNSPSHISFGWGEAAFYRATPTWAEFTLGNAMKALIWGEETLVHIYAERAPETRPDVTRFVLTPTAYRALASDLCAQIEGCSLKPPHKASPQAQAGYDPTNLFLPAHGRYSPFVTCNVWAARRLAAAGLRVAIWPPFAHGVAWSLAPPGSL
jgi:uncharacterized protein (TIGR02117 family)